MTSSPEVAHFRMLPSLTALFLSLTSAVGADLGAGAAVAGGTPPGEL